MNLKEQIAALIEEKTRETGHFLVEVKASPAKITVLIDHPAGISIDYCVSISRFLHDKYEGTDIFEKHELEVSSPGMDEPLKVLSQYKKRVGQQVSVLTYDGIKRSGVLSSVNETEIVLTESKPNKAGRKNEAEILNHNIPFTNIKETKVIFSFDKII